MMYLRRRSSAPTLLCAWLVLSSAAEAQAQPAAPSSGAGQNASPTKASDKPAAKTPNIATDKALNKPSADNAADKTSTDKSTADKASAETPAGANAAAAANANVEKAREHFKRGIDSYRDADLATALIEFKRAYSTAPNYRLLYNLGQVSADLRDYPAAERYLTQYLEESHSSLDEARKQQVQEELAKVRARIAYLSYDVVWDSPSAYLASHRKPAPGQAGPHRRQT